MRGVFKRLCALALALVLLVGAATVPARATAGVLATVAGAAVVSAWLMACGIYPYVTQDGQSFGEWGAGELRDLWNSYIDSFVDGQAPSGATKETFDKISGFVTGKTIAIAKGAWSGLRAFTNWIINKFSVTDNQTGVQLSSYSLPGIDGVYRMRQLPTGISSVAKEDVVLYGSASVQHSNGYAWYLCAGSGYDIYTFCNVSGSTIVETNISTYAGALYYAVSYNASTGVYDNSSFRSVRIASHYSFVDGIYTYSGYRTLTNYSSSSWSVGYPQSVSGNFNDIAKPYSKRVITDTGQEVVSSAVIADTTTVSVPAELPETATYGGLTIPDAISGTAPAITDVIEQGVTEREKPIVRPTVVEIAEGIEVDAETGEIISDKPVVVDESSIPLEVAAYQAPLSGLSSLFPFSIPWDIVRIFQALDAEPRFPLQDFSLTLDVPWLWGDAPPTVSFSLDSFPAKVQQTMDDVAAIVRAFLLIIACIGFLVFISQFLKF